MKKALIIAGVVVVCTIIGIVGYNLIFDSQGVKPPITVGGESGDNISGSDGLAAKAKVVPVTVRNKTDNISIENVYPTITSFKNKEFENSINKQIANNISAYRAEINYMVDDLTPEVKLYKYVTDYDKYTWGDYLTLVVNQDYQTGGIRSNKWKDIYNINVKTERLVYLDDLFDATTEYEDAIVAEITKQADAKGYKLMGGDGITKLTTKQKFYIQDGKLVIYFDPSEIAGATYGELTFEMPFTMGSDGYFQI